jgi:hypothetical protein
VQYFVFLNFPSAGKCNSMIKMRACRIGFNA